MSARTEEQARARQELIDAVKARREAICPFPRPPEERLRAG